MEINPSELKKLLIKLWSKDPELQNGVPYRRMATEAVDCIVSHLSSNAENIDDTQAMEDFIAQTFGELGVETVEFGGGYTIDCKPNLKFIPGEDECQQ